MKNGTWLSSSRWLAASLVAGMVIGGCDEHEPEPPGMAVEADANDAAALGDSTPGKPDVRPAATVAEPPVTVGNDTVVTGAALSPDGAVGAPRTVFAATDTVYVTLPTDGHAPGQTVKVYWTNAAGLSDKMESKTIAAGEDNVSFSFSQADGMASGAYNVQVDVEDVPVGFVDFTVE